MVVVVVRTEGFLLTCTLMTKPAVSEQTAGQKRYAKNTAEQ